MYCNDGLLRVTASNFMNFWMFMNYDGNYSTFSVSKNWLSIFCFYDNCGNGSKIDYFGVHSGALPSKEVFWTFFGNCLP